MLRNDALAADGRVARASPAAQAAPVEHAAASGDMRDDATPATAPAAGGAGGGAGDGGMPEVLEYTIHACSSYSGAYRPENILVNRPQHHASRWSSGSNNLMQFLTLKLQDMALVRSITFGKFHKVHVCNLREFKVYAGLSPAHLKEVLHTGLRNNAEPETFDLKTEMDGVPFPIQYIKIVPIQAWGTPNFNFSVWFVELRGTASPAIVSAAHAQLEAARERETVRMCLKHLRSRNLMEPFRALRAETGVELEHATLTALYEAVQGGDFDTVHTMLTSASETGLFDEYRATLPYTHVWERIMPTTSTAPWPRMRGGHQMALAPELNTLYLFGGWDGASDLGDLWAWDLTARTWECVSRDTSAEGGPTPRSCHSMVYCAATRQLFTVGRFVDVDARTDQSQLTSDLFAFDCTARTWTCLSHDTQADGGPRLLYDHQVAVDNAARSIYVFGGRALHDAVNGMFRYDIAADTWTALYTDGHHKRLHARSGHTMLFDPSTAELYVLSGVRKKEPVSDFFALDTRSGEVRPICADPSRVGGPTAGATRRGALNAERGEIYVMSGLLRDPDTQHETVKNAFWVYQIASDKWQLVFDNGGGTGDNDCPLPRFAHQLEYDARTHTFYLFGGNPGEDAHQKRLDDLWALTLHRESMESIVKRVLFHLQRHRFMEMCWAGDSMAALRFLQGDLASVVDHDDPAQAAEFHALTSTLFTASPNVTAETRRRERNALFAALETFYPRTMRQPTVELTDLVM